MNQISSTSKTTANPPQNGSVTHIQGQLITPVSFNTTKATPSNPIEEIPELLEEVELLIYNRFYGFLAINWIINRNQACAVIRSHKGKFKINREELKRLNKQMFLICVTVLPEHGIFIHFRNIYPCN